MQRIIIDEEFKRLIPPLDEDTYKSLEENILRNGCMYALVTWNGMLIDGHNRYEICMRHGIPFETVEKEFGSREEAIIWIISFQVSRRNLTPRQLSYFRGLHYLTEKKLVPNEDGINQYSEVVRQSDAQPKSTRMRLADHYRVSSKTIERDAKAAEAIIAMDDAMPGTGSKVISGEVSIGKMELERLSALPKDEIAAVAAEIDNGTYEKRKPAEQTAAEPRDSIGAILDDANALKASINKMSDQLRPDLLSTAKEKELSSLKAALRFCIDALERMYNKV